ncbi:hypothetical protein X975_11885, partial [Stegodyphus mimosarum]
MITEEAGDDLSHATGISLTTQELEILAEIDSSLYGFLKLNVPENAKKKALILKAVKCLERVLINYHQNKENDLSSSNKKQIEKISEKMSAIRTSDPP